MSEPPNALLEVEPHRLVPAELMIGGILFVTLGFYLVVSDLVSLGYVQSKSFLLGLTVAGFGVALCAIGYSLRTWHVTRDEARGALLKAK